MKIIIAGSRTITEYHLVEEAIRIAGFNITEVVSGTARGVDQLGEQWAAANNIPVRRFPADWNRYGRRAGYIRNAEMGVYAQGAVIVWDGSSAGTESMIEILKRRNLPTYIHQIHK